MSADGLDDAVAVHDGCQAVAGDNEQLFPRRLACSDFSASKSSNRHSFQQIRCFAAENGLDAKRKRYSADRDLLLSVLGASTTKRDAKSYLSQFQPAPDKFESPASQKVHLALVKVRDAAAIPDDVLHGVSKTLAQLARLGLQSVVVVEPAEAVGAPQYRKTALAQADRLVTALEQDKKTRARRVDCALGAGDEPESRAVPIYGRVHIQHSKILFDCIRSGTVPVIPPIAYETDSQRAVGVAADEAVLALARDLLGLPGKAHGAHGPAPIKERGFAIDRLIVLDALGGLPSVSRPDKAHVFVNLEQEFDDIQAELASPDAATAQHEQHARNLTLMRACLSLLPTTSSALLTTPSEAATVQQRPAAVSEIGVGTRRPKNSLLFSLLTDRPTVSSSLPVMRLMPAQADSPRLNRATFFKRGMTLTMIPDPREQAWAPPSADEPCISLNDPRIDLGRLLTLIEDSFGRKLNVEHYLDRVQHKLAGIIVAGQYEGGALLTWELPPGVPDDGSPESNARRVPYLDKFAVLKRSQGAGGVADIVFSAMVRSCFPDGVCWRSRADNPVNKWYFERARGTWRIAGTQWTMFWTTPGLVEDGPRFGDYESVCKAVQPSWADGAKPPS